MDAQKQESLLIRYVTEEKDLICDENEVILEGEAEEQGKTSGINDIFRLERERKWFSSEKSVCKLQEQNSKVILPGTYHSRQDDRDSTGMSQQVTSLTLEPIIAPTKDSCPSENLESGDGDEANCKPVAAMQTPGDGNRDSKTGQECCSHPPSVDALEPVEEEEAEQDVPNDDTAEMQDSCPSDNLERGDRDEAYRTSVTVAAIPTPQEHARISGPVPPISGPVPPVLEGSKDKAEEGDKSDQEVLIDVGNDGGSDYYSSDANGFQWKTLAVLLYVFVIAAFVMFGKMSHIDVNKDIPPSPDENKMNMDQSVKVILHQIQKRSEPVKILTYKILDQGEDCTDGIKRIQEMCQEGERALCVRNYTWKTLVAVCVENMTIDVFCPVFTLVINKEGTSFYAVQADWQSVCENCSDYGLWDIGKYPQCLQLEIMDTTTIDSTTTTNSTFVTPTPAGKKEDGEGLSGGYIALIVVPTVVVILVVVLVVLYKLGHLQRLREIPVRQEDI